MIRHSTQRFLLLLLTSTIVFVFIVVPYFQRKAEREDIKKHSLFTVGKIFKRTSSLKSGKYWNYVYKFKGVEYFDSRSTHVAYDVNIGDYFLVNFSSANPEHNMIYYNYKLANLKSTYGDSTCDSWRALWLSTYLLNTDNCCRVCD